MKRNTLIKVLGVAIVAVAILLVLSVVATPDGRYNYEIEYDDYFYTSNGEKIYAPSGEDFAIMFVTVYNDNASSIPTNLINWQFKLRINGLDYTSSIYSFRHNSYELVNIPKGGATTFVEVFEIPKGSHASSVSLDYIGFQSVVYEPDAPMWA